jgi:long-chain acyl-CoA synthetase
LGALPFFHSYGMTVCMNLGINGAGTIILMPNPRDIDEMLLLIDKYKVTLFPGVPTMYIALINHPETPKHNLRSVKACISGAAPLPVEVKQKFEQITGGKLCEGYGLTETSPVTHCNPIYGVNKAGSIGIPFPDTEARIVDLETGTKELPPGEVGELAIKGPQVMKGYWQMPEETALVFKEGWLLTGDIAKMDEDGYFYIVDRKKEMIIAGGYNIYPREVEEVLYQHPKVKEAAVVGVPDPYRGETVKAFVVLKEGEVATEEEIIEFCRKNLARYKVPTMVEFRKELPKSTVGKILRRVLAEEEKRKLQAQK